MISNVNVFGLEDSFKASKYPKAVDTSKCTPDLTETIKKLGTCVAGTGHDNFMNGIVVQFDLTMTIKMSTEAERYHFFDFVSSQSTMHKIMDFNLDESYIEYVDPRVIEIMKELVENYKSYPIEENFYKVIYTNPCGFKLTARMTTNYRQLKTMYKQRKTHRLPEWKEFCRWIETLPCSYLITGNVNKDN